MSLMGPDTDDFDDEQHNLHLGSYISVSKPEENEPKPFR
jgi:hypothetical protein